jgi:DNA-binding transcriptional LysR family regulator
MSYQLELRHLRYFLAVAEDLHFRKAAERLFISQPGLSKQIKELEQHLDLQLFDRHNRKVALTPAGAYLKKELSHYFNGLEQIIEHSKLLDRGMVGNLKLGYVGSAMQQIIPDLLLAFRNLQPKILFSLKEMDNQTQIEGLLSQEIDLAFVRLENLPRGLKTHPVLRESFCLVFAIDLAMWLGSASALCRRETWQCASAPLFGHPHLLVLLVSGQGAFGVAFLLCTEVCVFILQAASMAPCLGLAVSRLWGLHLRSMVALVWW